MGKAHGLDLGGFDLKKNIILRQRVILGIILLCGAGLFMWAGSVLYSGEPIVHLFDVEMQGVAVQEGGDYYVAGRNDAVFTPPRERPALVRRAVQPPAAEALERMADFSYLTSRLFLVDPETILLPSDINIFDALAADMSIDMTVDGPQVLIFHTHSHERFIDSDLSDPMSSIMGVGQYLARVLAEYHGIETMHYTGRFDVVNGIPHIRGSYERMEPVIRQILEDNPSIQLVIDLHRDGVSDHVPAFVHYVDGVRTAQIMFFNGLSRQHRNGQIIPLTSLENPYQRENLQFSLRLQLALNQFYPGLSRRIYLRAFRYSLHMMPLSTLVEVGNQHNTTQEAINAMYPLAEVIAAVVLGD